jgi:hypothetical protein
MDHIEIWGKIWANMGSRKIIYRDTGEESIQGKLES